MNIIDVGRRGLGKSVLAAHQAGKLNRNQIYFDPGNQFHRVDLKTRDLSEFTQRLENWPEDRPYSISYVPPKSSVAVSVEDHWNTFSNVLWDFMGEHDGGASFALVIDEAHRLQSPQAINNMLDEFIRRAPRRERDDRNPVDIIQTTHAPQDLHRVSWGESDYIYLFNIFDKRALKAIEEQFESKIENIKEIVTTLKTPKTGGREVLEIESETGNYRIITDPAEWYNNIRQPKPPTDDGEAIEREMAKTYGE